MLLPPEGRMGAVYRVAREHQKGPFCGAWYYLEAATGLQESDALGRLLLAEAFANGGMLMGDTENPRLAGTIKSHAWWNGFVRRVEGELGRRDPRGDVGLVYSPDNQLGPITPGGFGDMDRQPHVFGHWGWAEALMAGHVPYQVVTDWRLPELRPGSLRTLVLPDVECLSDAAAQAIADWVRAGGRLVVTGATGTRYGPEGWFLSRPESALRTALGEALPAWVPGRPLAVNVGAGEVLWDPASLGMRYYLEVEQRPQIAESILGLTGGTALVSAPGMPESVGLFTWQRRDGAAVFADLVNYGYDRAADETAPAQGLEFALRLPEGWTTARAELLSPDGTAGLTCEVEGGWARLRLERLEAYGCVKVTGG